MKRRSLWRPGLYLAGLGAAYFAGTWPFIRMPGEVKQYYVIALDPYLLPRWSGILLLISGLWLALSLPAEQATKSPKENADAGGGAAWLRLLIRNDVLLAAALLFVFLTYAFSMQYLGFTIPTVVMMSVEVLVLGERSRRKAVIVSLLYTVAIYVLFARFIQLPLPTGWVGF